jgi:hypothetical protein
VGEGTWEFDGFEFSKTAPTGDTSINALVMAMRNFTFLERLDFMLSDIVCFVLHYFAVNAPENRLSLQEFYSATL